MKVIPMVVLASLSLVTSARKVESKKNPVVLVETTISVPADTAFNYIVPVKLEHIFKKYRNLPAITHTDERELWFSPGLTRTVYFEDGSTAKESLLTVVAPSSFSYKIEAFTSRLRFLARRIEGSWMFTPLPDGNVKIQWTYTVIPQNFVTKAAINMFLLKNIRELLNNALMILKADLESDPRRS